MKKPLLFTVTALMLSSLACSINIELPDIDDTGPTQTVTINEVLPENPDDAMAVYLGMGAGDFNLSGGADELASGTIRYNIERWEPVITRGETSLSIEQNTTSNFSVSENIRNEWDIQLNNDTLLDLEIHAGAYQGNMDFSGLRLRNLDIADGASSVKVRFDTVNPEEMERFRYSTGASQVEMTGLANANFDSMTFDSGAGDYTLDFSGELQQDATVRIHSGISQVTIIIPDGTRAEIITSGGLSNVDTEGTWNTSGDSYSTSGDGNLLTINVEMGVGNLRLIQQASNTGAKDQTNPSESPEDSSRPNQPDQPENPSQPPVEPENSPDGNSPNHL